MRYLLELAERAKDNPLAKIPILVRLKDYQISSDSKYSGIVHLIRKELISLELEEIERYLFEKRKFLLLIDGLNESTSSELRKDLQQFLDSCRKRQVPIVFTTRLLGYRHLEVETQLEIQSVSSEERQRFLKERVSPAKQQQLQGWLDRSRQSDYTPFVLWMLAEVCEQINSSSQLENFSLGEAFREFVRLYQDKLYEEGRISDEDCEVWTSKLKHLASEMLSDEISDNFIVFRNRAIDILGSEALLNNLIQHHLLVESRGNGKSRKIEFCHQLLQEYYAAEDLLQKLPELLEDEQGKWKFQHDYLNYLKWTEAIGLMLGLPETTEEQALKIVELALNEVDLMLGARLAGEVKEDVQEKTIEIVSELKVPEWLKIELLGKTQSEKAIAILSQFIAHSDSGMRWKAIETLGTIKSEQIAETIVQLLNHSDFVVRRSAANELGKLGLETAIPGLITALKDDLDPDVRWKAAYTLGEIGSKEAISGLCTALQNPNPDVRWKAAYALGEIGSKEAMSELRVVLQDVDPSVRFRAVEALGKIGSEEILSELLKLAEKDPARSVRGAAYKAINVIRQGKEAISAQNQAIQDLYSTSVQHQIDILEQNILVRTFDELINELNSSDPNVRKIVVKVLGQRDFDKVINTLINVLKNDANSSVRWSAAKTLQQNGSDEAINALLSAIENPNFVVRITASEALGRIEGNRAAKHLPHLFTLIATDVGQEAFSTILGIQAKCQFYNYEITQSDPPSAVQPLPSQIQTGVTMNFYKDVHGVAGVVQGNQITYLPPPDSHEGDGAT